MPNDHESYGTLASKIDGFGDALKQIAEGVNRIGAKVDNHSDRLATIEATQSTLGVRSFQEASSRDRAEIRSELKQQAQKIATIEAEQARDGETLDRVEADVEDLKRTRVGQMWSWQTLMKIGAFILSMLGAAQILKHW